MCSQLCDKSSPPLSLFIAIWAKAFKKELLLRSYENNFQNCIGLTYAEDILSNVAYCSYIKTINYLKTPLYYYCENNETSATRTKDKEKISKNVQDLQKVIDYLENFYSFKALIAKIESCNLKIAQIDFKYRYLSHFPFKFVLKFQRKWTKIRKKALISKALSFKEQNTNALS